MSHISFKNMQVRMSDLRYMARRKCRIKLFDGRHGRIKYPYFSWHETIVFDNGKKESGFHYQPLEEVIDHIKFIHVDNVKTAERRKHGEKLFFTGKGYKPIRYVRNGEKRLRDA
jgi:hypothetical protein